MNRARGYYASVEYIVELNPPRHQNGSLRSPFRRRGESNHVTVTMPVLDWTYTTIIFFTNDHDGSFNIFKPSIILHAPWLAQLEDLDIMMIIPPSQHRDFERGMISERVTKLIIGWGWHVGNKIHHISHQPLNRDFEKPSRSRLIIILYSEITISWIYTSTLSCDSGGWRNWWLGSESKWWWHIQVPSPSHGRGKIIGHCHGGKSESSSSP